ncbi:hypothetical protein [Streptomyces sp. RTGN2]|uniref:hypothetical protein n=1 Tax=Streptomyces sp. RTGN2 TaxID=3016525 RepID=UPI002556EAEC|nr:hypothetical protein [Streptomyces sp. RTGN2]
MTPALARPALISTGPHPTRPRPAPDRDDLNIELPAAFRAFHALHQPAYRDYAAAHTTAAADDILREAFGTLAAHWSDTMLRPDPNAYAWDLFASVVQARTQRLRLPANSPLQYEIVVLHHLAGWAPRHIADTTGRDPGKIRYLLRTWAQNEGTPPPR